MATTAPPVDSYWPSAPQQELKIYVSGFKEGYGLDSNADSVADWAQVSTLLLYYASHADRISAHRVVFILTAFVSRAFRIADVLLKMMK